MGTADVAAKHFVPSVQASRNGIAHAIASRSAERARQFADRFEIPRAHGSYEELLADEDVDAVYLPLPISLHCEWALRCAEAGKPVLCEKPLALNTEQARRMVDAFAERDLLLGEALMYRHHPVTRRIKQMVDEGQIGEVRVIQAVFCCQIEDMDNIRLRRETGGGALLDVGSYCVSVMRLIAGEEPGGVRAAAHWGEQSGVDESLVGTLTFPSGIVGSLACSVRTEFGCNYDIYGSKGRIFLHKGVVPNPDEDAVIRCWRNYELEETVVPAVNQWQLVFEDFADALIEGRPVQVPPEEAVLNLRVIDRLLADARP
jgi:predicted dehydrogenase